MTLETGAPKVTLRNAPAAAYDGAIAAARTCYAPRVITATLGIRDLDRMTHDDVELVKRVHLLLAMYNARQPGVFALSGWDLVGMLPLGKILGATAKLAKLVLVRCLAAAQPPLVVRVALSCVSTWVTLAGIATVESGHGTFRGRTLQSTGLPSSP